MKTRKQTKQGISLIVLVITIIVMIILAAAIILSLTSNGLINRANEAVNQSNLSQVKTLAQTIWSEVYLENLDKPEGQKLDYQTEVIKRLNEQKIDTTKFDIVADGNGVTVTNKGEGTWITLYENDIPTTSYMLQVANRNIFVSNTKYRITIEGIGTVETTAVYAGIEFGMQAYGLFGIDDGNLIGIESLEDMQEKMQAASENAIMVCGLYDAENNVSLLMFDNAKTEYTVTKVEKFKMITPPINGELIYSGDLELIDGQYRAILDADKFEIGDKYILACDYGEFESHFFVLGLMFLPERS